MMIAVLVCSALIALCQISTVAADDFCTVGFNIYPQTQVAGLIRQLGNYTEQTCTERCLLIAECAVLTFVPFDNSCWLGGTKNTVKTLNYFMNTREKTKVCPGYCKSTFNTFANQQALGLTLQPGNYTEDTCTARCGYAPDCWVLTFIAASNQCWLSNAVNAPKVAHAGMITKDRVNVCPVYCTTKFTTFAQHLVLGLTRQPGNYTEQSCEDRCALTSSCWTLTHVTTDQSCWFGNVKFQNLIWNGAMTAKEKDVLCFNKQAK